MSALIWAAVVAFGFMGAAAASSRACNIYYEDSDGDGYGNDNVSICEDEPPFGYVDWAGDCDDGNSSVNPDATEVCDGIDNDCNGQADDEYAEGCTDYYRDADGDGHGSYYEGICACSAPSGYVEVSDDCDDGNSGISPSAQEVCDDFDNDCDSEVDEEGSLGCTIFYEDNDFDGRGTDLSTVCACSRPFGYAELPGDCDDFSFYVYPGADEYCDFVDNDCDFEIDEGEAVDCRVFYRDLDGDSYGDEMSTTCACNPPDGYTDAYPDCDDTNPDSYPAAPEICDGQDNDCDSVIDDDAVDCTGYYRDADGDSFGDESDGICACSRPDGYAESGGDCDDADPGSNPAAVEECDGVDNDCDGIIDNGFGDSDSDGFLDCVDNCPDDANPGQENGDGDAKGDACDLCPGFDDSADADGDSVPDGCDLCPGVGTDCNGNGASDCDETTIGGLIGSYYPHPDLTGSPRVRVDAGVSFDWGDGGPIADIAADNFSARWTGFVRTGAAGTYTFITNSDDGVRLWVNGQLLIEDWSAHAPKQDSATIDLAADTVNSITLEYFEAGGGAVIQLRWIPPGGADTVIPRAALTPALDCNSNGIPDECEPDSDGDGVPDDCDNCPATPNPGQSVHPLDFDGDCDIDGSDVMLFAACQSGPTVAVSSGCEPKDLDHDSDCDADDFGMLQRCISGAGTLPDPACAD